MTHPTGSDLRRPVVIVVTAVLAALFVRVVYVLQISDPLVNPFFDRPILDAAVHQRWAQGLLAGTWPPAEPFFRAPLYPLVLGGLYAVCGAGHPLPVQLIHALISALGAGLAASCALRLWGTRAGWCAGLGYAALWPSIFYCGELLDVTLAVTLNLLLWWLLLGDLSRRRLFLAGLVWGLSAVTRPTVLALLPVIALYLRKAERPVGSRLRWTGVWLMAAGLATAILPVTIHNLVRGGQPVVIAASGGVNFFIGNNPYADGRVAFLPGAPADWQGELADATALATRETGRPMTALAADRYFLGKGLAFWTQRTGEALRLTARKLWLLVRAREGSNEKNLAFWRDRSSLLRWRIWLGWAPVLALAVVGLRRRDHPSGAGFLMTWSVIAYAAALVLFFVNARFRLPVLAWLVVPAGGGADQLWRWLRARQWSLPHWKPLALGMVVLLVAWLPDALGPPPDPADDFECWRSLGAGYQDAGRTGEARRAYQAAVDCDRRWPRDAFMPLLPALYSRLGDLMLADGDVPAARGLFETWVARLPQQSEGRVRLADLYLQLGQGSAARQQLEDVLHRHPDHPGARFRMGMCLMQLQRWDEAEAVFLAIVQVHPDAWQAYGNLAALYEQTGRPQLARQAWDQVLAINPDDATARQRLVALGEGE